MSRANAYTFTNTPTDVPFTHYRTSLRPSTATLYIAPTGPPNPFAPNSSAIGSDTIYSSTQDRNSDSSYTLSNQLVPLMYKHKPATPNPMALPRPASQDPAQLSERELARLGVHAIDWAYAASQTSVTPNTEDQDEKKGQTAETGSNPKISLLSNTKESIGSNTDGVTGEEEAVADTIAQHPNA